MAESFDSLFADPDELSELEGSALAAILTRHGVNKVLDCACGTGIQALALARRGFAVAASDISRKMVEVIQGKAASAGLELETRVADFRNLAPWHDSVFDGVICCGNSLTLVPRRQHMVKALEAMHRRLRPSGGVVVIGIHDYLKAKGHGDIVLANELGAAENGRTAVVAVRHVFEEHTLVEYVTLSRRGGRWSARSVRKSYWNLPQQRLSELLVNSGFSDVKWLELDGRKPYRGGEWYLAVGRC